MQNILVDLVHSIQKITKKWRSISTTEKEIIFWVWMTNDRYHFTPITSIKDEKLDCQHKKKPSIEKVKISLGTMIGATPTISSSNQNHNHVDEKEIYLSLFHANWGLFHIYFTNKWYQPPIKLLSRSVYPHLNGVKEIATIVCHAPTIEANCFCTSVIPHMLLQRTAPDQQELSLSG